jgi:hypothetical protein
MPASIRARNAVTIVVAVVLVLGPVAYFVAFFLAYAFNESISAATHAFFLGEITTFAVIMAVVAAPFVGAAAAIPWGRAFRLAVALSIAINFALVGIGSIVSAMNADQNSVTAEYAWTTDVLLAAGLFGVAAVAGRVAVRLRPR